MSVIDKLSTHGMVNADDLLEAAHLEKFPLFIAAAFAEKESNGANIYGHDAGGYNWGVRPVTRANYQDFYEHVVKEGHTSNGVGPMQITWPGFFPDAANKGLRLWLPVDNFRYGFQLIESYLHGRMDGPAIEEAGTRYNGAAVYGRSVRALANTWLHRLGDDAGVPSKGSPKATKPRKAVKPRKTPSRLHLGSTGRSVYELQSGLNEIFPAYSDLKEDRVFGKKTEAVVKQFQRNSGLVADGIVGPKTRRELAEYGIKV